MKKFISIFILILLMVVGFFGYEYFQDKTKLGSTISGGENLVGSISNLQSVPNRSFATTTVDQAYADPPSSIKQDFYVAGSEDVLLVGAAKGSYATSTLFIQVLGSYDGTNFFNIASSTTDTVYNSTSSIMTVAHGRSFDIVPGTATSTFSKLIDNPGFDYLRILFYDDRNAPYGAAYSHLSNVQAFLRLITVTENN